VGHRGLGVSGGDGDKPPYQLDAMIHKNVVWDYPNKINIIGGGPYYAIFSSNGIHICSLF